MPTLSAIVEQLCQNSDVSYDRLLEDFCLSIAAVDHQNAHLVADWGPREVRRSTPLHPDTQVFGNFFIIVYWGHWPSLTLENFDDEPTLAERAETCKRCFDEVWLFINGQLRDCKFVDSYDAPGYTVHSTACGYLFAIANRT